MVDAIRTRISCVHELSLDTVAPRYLKLETSSRASPFMVLDAPMLLTLFTITLDLSVLTSTPKALTCREPVCETLQLVVAACYEVVCLSTKGFRRFSHNGILTEREKVRRERWTSSGRGRIGVCLTQKARCRLDKLVYLLLQIFMNHLKYNYEGSTLD